MKKSNELAAKADNWDLDLPDWSGMDDSTSSRISVEATFRLCEEYLALYPLKENWRSARPPMCEVEFKF
jgi:hypothetical protein